MIQILPIALMQVKADEHLKTLNQIRQIIYSLYRAKEITKKSHYNIMNSIKVWYKNEYYIYEFWK